MNKKKYVLKNHEIIFKEKTQLPQPTKTQLPPKNKPPTTDSIGVFPQKTGGNRFLLQAFQVGRHLGLRPFEEMWCVST